VILSAAIGSLLLAVPPLRGVANEIADLSPAWVLAATLLEVGSCLGFVVIFRMYFDDVPPAAARELAFTEQGSGAILPGGGVGALAIGGWLLRRTGMSTSRIIDRSSAFFFLTSAVNVAALVGGGVLLLVREPDGASDLLRAGIPILGGLAGYALLRRRLGGSATQRPTPSSRSVASSGTPPKYAASTCRKVGFAESA